LFKQPHSVKKAAYKTPRREDQYTISREERYIVDLKIKYCFLKLLLFMLQEALKS